MLSGLSVYVPSQWEMTLHCNVVSFWLGSYTTWSLHLATSSMLILLLIPKKSFTMGTPAMHRSAYVIMMVADAPTPNRCQVISNHQAESAMTTMLHEPYYAICIWVRLRRCGCLVTWFCYQMIAKPGNKTAPPWWPDSYSFKAIKQAVFRRGREVGNPMVSLLLPGLFPQSHNALCGLWKTWHIEAQTKWLPFSRRHIQSHFFCQDCCILIKILLKFVSQGPMNNIPALVKIMAWCPSGNKPLSEPMMVTLMTHICVTRPQWVNKAGRPKL